METLETTLQSILDKYKNEYKSICEPISGFVSRRNNASKFTEINKKLVSEIIEKLNLFMEINPNSEKNKIIEIGQIYIKNFQKQIINPFS